MQGAKGQKKGGEKYAEGRGQGKEETREKFRGESRKRGTGLKPRSESARTEKENAPACACRPTGLPTAVAQ